METVNKINKSGDYDFDQFRRNFHDEHGDIPGRHLILSRDGITATIQYDDYYTFLRDVKRLREEPGRAVHHDEHDEELAGDGWVDGLDIIEQRRSEIETDSGMGRRWETEQAVAGGRPDVPASVKGVPKKQKKLIDTRAQGGDDYINFVVNTACSGAASTEQKTKGAVIAGVIDDIQAQGTRVKLDVAKACNKGYATSNSVKVTIKDYDENMDLEELAFVLCHQQFNFGLVWTIQDMLNSTVNDYTQSLGKNGGCPIPKPGCWNYDDIIYAPAIHAGHGPDWSDSEAVKNYFVAQLEEQGINIE